MKAIIFRFLGIFSFLFGVILYFILCVPGIFIGAWIYIFTGKDYFSKYVDILMYKIPNYFISKAT